MALAIGVARMPTQGTCRPLVTTSADLAAGVDGLAQRDDEAGRLNRSRHIQILADADAAEHATRFVRYEAARRQQIVVGGAALIHAGKPAPFSAPLTALMPIMAKAMSASSLSNSGSPSPTGTFNATT